jgi:ureidoacrylate peracid hydrolase
MAHDPYWDLVLEMPEPGFEPLKTAFVIIDLQYMDAHPDGWMGRLCRDQGKPDHLKERFDFIQDILPNVKRMQVACREAGVQVIHVRIAFRRYDTRDGKRALLTKLEQTPLDARDNDILDEIAPEGDDMVIDKTSVSTFNSTAIDQILRNMDIDRLWVAGIVTEGCVELTARDALDRGYFVSLVTDCCASSTHVAHDDALQRMNDGGQIKLHTSEELIGWMEEVKVKAVAA